jgi:hypothetical protein
MARPKDVPVRLASGMATAQHHATPGAGCVVLLVGAERAVDPLVAAGHAVYHVTAVSEPGDVRRLASLAGAVYRDLPLVVAIAEAPDLLAAVQQQPPARAALVVDSDGLDPGTLAASATAANVGDEPAVALPEQFGGGWGATIRRKE